MPVREADAQKPIALVFRLPYSLLPPVRRRIHELPRRRTRGIRSHTEGGTLSSLFILLLSGVYPSTLVVNACARLPIRAAAAAFVLTERRRALKS